MRALPEIIRGQIPQDGEEQAVTVPVRIPGARINEAPRVTKASRASEAHEGPALFAYRIVSENSSLAVSQGGLGTFVFTGEISRNAEAVRAAMSRSLSFPGLDFSPRLNPISYRSWNRAKN